MRSHLVIAAAILAVIALIGIGTFAVAEYVRDRKRDALDRKRDKRERKRDKAMKELLARMAAMPPVLAPVGESPPSRQVVTDQPPTPARTERTLRRAAFDLAKEMRAFLADIPSGLSREEEHERIFGPFLNTFWPRLHTVKDRLENVLPRWSVVSSVEWLPTDRESVQNTLDALEREANEVSPDIPE